MNDKTPLARCGFLLQFRTLRFAPPKRAVVAISVSLLAAPAVATPSASVNVRIFGPDTVYTRAPVPFLIVATNAADTAVRLFLTGRAPRGQAAIADVFVCDSTGKTIWHYYELSPDRIVPDPAGPSKPPTVYHSIIAGTSREVSIRPRQSLRWWIVWDSKTAQHFVPPGKYSAYASIPVDGGAPLVSDTLAVALVDH